MKAINLYINESLVKSKPIGTFDEYKYHPQSKEELSENIIAELKTGNTDLNCIDTSAITDMSHLFDTDYGDIHLNRYNNIDISQWNVSNVTDMTGMFGMCKKFNCDISNWDVHNVKDMQWLFYACPNFNCDISKWDVSNVTNMSAMFYGCTSFTCDISTWDVNKVTYIHSMFIKCPLRDIFGVTPQIKNGKFVKK